MIRLIWLNSEYKFVYNKKLILQVHYKLGQLYIYIKINIEKFKQMTQNYTSTIAKGGLDHFITSLL
jgi:hypothetical protein